MSQSEPLVELEDVSAELLPEPAIEGISFVVRRGEAVALVGGNSSGKNLAFRIAAGLEEPQTGHVRLLGLDPYQLSEGEHVKLRRRIGVAFDRHGLLSNMSVFNNVALPLRYHTFLTESEVNNRVTTGLESWGVEALRDLFPADLTLGDARLVALARAQVLDPEILFIDEMAVGLDTRALARLRDFFDKNHAEGGPTLVTSASAPTPLLEHMDRLIFFRQGRLVATGKPLEIAALKDPAVQEMLTL